MADRKPAKSRLPTNAPGSAAVDDYLAQVEPEAHRLALETLRGQVRALAPDATEGISYGIPGFKYKGRGLAWYGSWKSHCSFFPGGVAHDYADRLEGYKLQKGTIQFKADKPIPADVIEAIVRDRMATIDAGGR
jgi:uncharacterized protein YdhG (YjbR/CyaY superfamily)